MLMENQRTQKVFGLVGGANKINTQTGLASLSGAAVVKPNVDTVYSRVVIDLSKDDLVLTVPNITDRFSIFPFYDVFGNDFASISPVTHSTPGKYLLRRSDDALVQPGLHVLNTSEPHPVYGSKYQGLVNFPTTYGTMLIRILVKQNTTEDLDIVHRYQSQYTIEPTPRKVTQPGNSTSSSIVQTLNNVTTNVTSALPVLEFLAKIASFNQPEVLSDRYRVASILGLAGISNGRYVRPEVVNLTRAFEDAVSTYTNITSAPENINESLGNGWQLSNPPFEVSVNCALDNCFSRMELLIRFTGQFHHQLRTSSSCCANRVPATDSKHCHLSRLPGQQLCDLFIGQGRIISHHLSRQTAHPGLVVIISHRRRSSSSSRLLESHSLRS